MEKNIEFTEQDAFNSGFKHALRLSCDGLATLDQNVPLFLIMKSRLKISKMRDALEETLRELDLTIQRNLEGEIG